MDIEQLDGDDGGHIAPLSADTIPDANQAHYCFSCEEPITGVYCTSCGQKNDDFRRSIFSLVIETISTMFGFESRIWRTWLTLLTKPGKVAREYADGARTKWSSPVRVYIAMSIILFGFLSCTQTQIVSINIDAERADGAPVDINDMTPKDVSIKFSTQMFVRQSEIDARNEVRNFDLIELWLREGINFNSDDDDEDTEEENSNGEVAIEDGPDAQTQPKEAIADEAGKTVTGEIQNDAQAQTETNTGNNPKPNTIYVSDAFGNQRSITSNEYAPVIMAIIRNPEIINRGLFKYLPRVMFIMMPFCMLLGALFIRGKRALLFDHLVHAAYIHAVAFLLLLIGIIIGLFFKSPAVNLSLLGIMTLYLPLSLKRMFGRGWFKTVLTSYTVGLNYLLTILFLISYILIQDLTGFYDNFTPP